MKILILLVSVTLCAAKFDDLWSTWKEMHGKQYSDDEELIRFVRKLELSLILLIKD